MTQYNPIKSEQIKNTLCMQCSHQSCLMIIDGVCPALSGSKQKPLKPWRTITMRAYSSLKQLKEKGICVDKYLTN